jgi:hypothetical protein
MYTIQCVDVLVLIGPARGKQLLAVPAVLAVLGVVEDPARHLGDPLATRGARRVRQPPHASTPFGAEDERAGPGAKRRVGAVPARRLDARMGAAKGAYLGCSFGLWYVWLSTAKDRD